MAQSGSPSKPGPQPPQPGAQTSQPGTQTSQSGTQTSGHFINILIGLLEEQEFGQTGDSFERFRLLEARDLLRDRTEATQQAIEEEGQRLDRIAKKLDGIESVLDQIEFYCAHRGDDTPTSPVREDALRIEELDEAIAPLQTKADELDIQIMEAMRRQKQSLS